MTTIETVTEEAAAAALFHPLTFRYRLPEEQWMLDRVRADMRRGGIEHVLVRAEDGLAVWRRGHYVEPKVETLRRITK